MPVGVARTSSSGQRASGTAPVYAALETTALSFRLCVCDRKWASVNWSARAPLCHRAFGNSDVMGSVNRSTSRSASSEMPKPVNDLLVDAMYQSVRSSARTPELTSAIP